MLKDLYQLSILIYSFPTIHITSSSHLPFLVFPSCCHSASYPHLTLSSPFTAFDTHYPHSTTSPVQTMSSYSCNILKCLLTSHVPWPKLFLRILVPPFATYFLPSFYLTQKLQINYSFVYTYLQNSKIQHYLNK